MFDIYETLDIKTKGGLLCRLDCTQHDLQYHADKNEPIWFYGVWGNQGMLVNTLSKSFRLSGATKIFSNGL